MKKTRLIAIILTFVVGLVMAGSLTSCREFDDRWNDGWHDWYDNDYLVGVWYFYDYYYNETYRDVYYVFNYDGSGYYQNGGYREYFDFRYDARSQYIEFVNYRGERWHDYLRWENGNVIRLNGEYWYRY